MSGVREKPVDALGAHSGRQGRLPRFSIGTGLLVFVMLAIGFGMYAWLNRNIIAPREHRDALEELLRSLAERRPEGVTRGQWGSAVGWTLNLHGNSLAYGQISDGVLANLEERVRDRLEQSVSMETIDWIWEEYGKVSPSAKNYHRFKVMMQEEIDSIRPDAKPWQLDIP